MQSGKMRTVLVVLVFMAGTLWIWKQDRDRQAQEELLTAICLQDQQSEASQDVVEGTRVLKELLDVDCAEIGR